jgi:hypothetical protein
LPQRWSEWSFGPAMIDQVQILAVGAIAGGWLGRMIGYGRLTAILAHRGLRLRISTAHPDGAGGLKPIGDFCLFQSLIASIPAMFLAVWSLVVSLASAGSELAHYRPFLPQYLWLLLVAIGFEVAVFAVPLWLVHAQMRMHKLDVALPAADRLAPAIETAWTELGVAPPAEQEAVRRRLTDLTDRVRELEQAPTWPIDPVISRRFTFRSLGLFTPIVGYLASQPDLWQAVLHALPRT